MKAEERHEMQENVLAGMLGNALKTIAPYQSLILGVIFLSVALWLGVSWLQARRDALKQVGWTELFEVTEAADLDRVASKHGGTMAGVWALQKSADLNVQQGAAELYRDRKKAREHFEKARELYADVLKSSDIPMILQRAEYGIAQSSEALEEFSKAKEHYGTVAEKWPGSVAADYALDRIKQLGDPSTADFYTWFMQQPPPISDEMLQSEGAGGPAAGGSLDTNLSSDPDIELPSALDPDTEDSTEGAEDRSDRETSEPASP